jgi:hypothetical protein
LKTVRVEVSFARPWRHGSVGSRKGNVFLPDVLVRVLNEASCVVLRV